MARPQRPSYPAAASARQRVAALGRLGRAESSTSTGCRSLGTILHTYLEGILIVMFEYSCSTGAPVESFGSDHFDDFALYIFIRSQRDS